MLFLSDSSRGVVTEHSVGAAAGSNGMTLENDGWQLHICIFDSTEAAELSDCHSACNETLLSAALELHVDLILDSMLFLQLF